ncbi:MAG: tRNA pseudouridine(13) synthase TruD [Candidatus Hodarchaeota archaeon]
MKEAHPLEATLGMELYSTDCPGAGGKLKARFEHFVVEEITPAGQVLELQEWKESTTELTIKGEKSRFIRFVMQKMGLTTLDVAAILASELRLPQHLVTSAGLKDKRAVTNQMMSVPARAAGALGKMDLSRIQISNPEYSRKPIQIGDLWGNRFSILLTDMDSDCNTALEAVECVHNTPLLNYFGVQRFGITRPFTHIIGKSLVQKDYEEAIRNMLTLTTEHEPEELTTARIELRENLAPTEKIVEAFPEDLRYEREVMRNLMKRPGEYKRALSKIPSRVLTIFVHSYQSYLFNTLISRRATEGIPIDVPEVGDFLIQLDETHSGRDSWLFVTEYNLEERIDQVSKSEYGLAAPLPGYSTKTPPSKQTDLLNQVLREEGVSLIDFRNSEWKALDSSGGLHLVSIIIPTIERKCGGDGLWLRFSLRKGSYATVIMREIMKNDPINRV